MIVSAYDCPLKTLRKQFFSEPLFKIRRPKKPKGSPMSREERKLRKHLEAHARRELRKALSKARVKDWKPPRERVNLNQDEDYLPPVKKKTRTEQDVRTSTGFVVETGPGFCDVLRAGERIRCRHSGDGRIGDQVLSSPD